MSTATKRATPVQPVPLLDLQAQYAVVGPAIERAVLEVLRSQRFILGPVVEAFERDVARYSQCAHAIGMSSGTDALLAVLMAEGIGPGDEVITSPFSFFATAGAIARLGARPVFVDIDPASFNLDPARVEAAWTAKTRAIIPVHLFGQMAELAPLLRLARERNAIVIEDAAQAIGAELDGKRAGSLGDYGCFSFFPSKNLGGAGDGGMVVCQDAARAERLQVMRAHGGKKKYFHDVIGGNFRLDALQAAVLQVKLAHLDAWTEARQANAAHYRALFAASGKVVDVAELREPDQLVLPRELPGRRHIYNQFVIRVTQREALRAALTAQGIGCEVYYPRAFHQQACFAYLEYDPHAFPHSELACDQCLALPIYPELTRAQIETVVAAVLEHLAA